MSPFNSLLFKEIIVLSINAFAPVITAGRTKAKAVQSSVYMVVLI